MCPSLCRKDLPSQDEFCRFAAQLLCSCELIPVDLIVDPHRRAVRSADSESKVSGSFSCALQMFGPGGDRNFLPSASKFLFQHGPTQ